MMSAAIQTYQVSIRRRISSHWATTLRPVVIAATAGAAAVQEDATVPHQRGERRPCGENCCQLRHAHGGNWLFGAAYGRHSQHASQIKNEQRSTIARLERMCYAGVMARPEYIPITCKSALNRVQGMPFKWSLNPYAGCVHACVYCYARSHYQLAGHGDAGREFETRILVKTNVAEVLRRELGRPPGRSRRSRWAPSPTATSRPKGASGSPGPA